MVLGAVKTMCFWYDDSFKKVSLTSGISNIKIGQKSGNTFQDFLHYTGNF